MRVVWSTIGDDIQDEGDARDSEGIKSDDLTRGAQSDKEGQVSNDLQSQEESDVVWDEVEYEVYGDFQDSDRYQSSEQMAIMREDEPDLDDSMSNHENDSEYKTAPEDMEEEGDHVVKYMTTWDFGEAPDRSPIYQY
ncbi:uncharacterized protein ARMOST_19831 [Armillaria ostoyae]|uniref:Uncharacterized protein n=1 Tax=Armillaria ostoyae TaxID=47428 RepID=A0A284S5M2_ARMOS|nr:uncharacterized protein ARMOST_19831 [Armillaria ostoyae]